MNYKNNALLASISGGTHVLTVLRGSTLIWTIKVVFGLEELAHQVYTGMESIVF